MTDNDRVKSDELIELRSLLFGIEPSQLNLLNERLEQLQITAEDISRLLPEAVILRTLQDQQLGEAIVPTVEHAIQASVKQDLNVLANAIFPIIGPAIRKAISTALGQMMQSLNQTLEHSLSPQSFKWRLEARQTGKSFAEVVLLRTLIYRVEQVFLIHKRTGLLLQHVVAAQVVTQDPDLVSAMLTAIQDFVKDAFSMPQGDVLQTLEFGEITIWIEEGPQAVLAGMVRGRPPQELKLVFQEVIEKIHLQFDQELNSFDGGTEPFAACKPYLDDCLEARYQSPPKNNYTYGLTLLGTIAIALTIWICFTITEQLRWNAFLDKLNSQPGIVVLKAERQYSSYYISGMRDPLAIDPKTLMAQFQLHPQTVTTQWKPYLSFEPQFTVKRAEQLLQPPKTVSMVSAKNILYVNPKASIQWILTSRRLWRFIPGITGYSDRHLVEIETNDLKSYLKQAQ